MRDMKESGVEWIGTIPASWESMTIGSLFNVRNEKVNDTDYPPLSVTKYGVVPQLETVAKSDANDNRKKVLANDFVINSRSDRKQSCGLARFDGSVSLINTVLYLKKDAPIIPEFLNYLLKNDGFAEEFYRWGHGIVADLWTTRWQDMKKIPIPVPPIEEQERFLSEIVMPLDKVLRLTANVFRQIEKLKAYKQSLITEVVTKGLDPTVPMKDSGIQWIGDIPAHWGTPKISMLATVSSGATPDRTHSEYWNGTISWLKTGELQNNEIYESEEYITEIGLKNSSVQLYEPNTILVAMYGQGKTRGMTALLRIQSTTNQACAGIVVTSDLISYEYLWKTLMGAYNGLRELAVGSGQPNLNQALIKDFRVPLPPVQEQNDICEFLAKKLPQIDRLIAIKQAKIEKLEQYKRSLIYEYVTGKREVL